MQEAETLEELNESCNAAGKQNQKGVAQDEPQGSPDNLGKLDSIHENRNTSTYEDA